MYYLKICKYVFKIPSSNSYLQNTGVFCTSIQQYDRQNILLRNLICYENLTCYISIYFPIKAFITFISFIASDLFYEIYQTLRVLFLNYLSIHNVWNHSKCFIWFFFILVFSINFCPFKIDLSGNTFLPQTSGLHTR